MNLKLSQLTKDISNLDIEDILSCWKWIIPDMKSLVTISVLGDMFLAGQNGAIYWLQTDCGDLTKVADDFEQFNQFLYDDDKVDNWFLPLLVEKLITAGKTLNENEVYSYKKIPVLGGEYSVENIEPTDMSVHFAISGQICEGIKDMPNGTLIKISLNTNTVNYNDMT